MVSIVEVTTKAQLRRFVDYPNQLYRGVPQFVPATYGDDLSDWDRQKNPAFSYCDARCWLAERDGEIVGRLAAPPPLCGLVGAKKAPTAADASSSQDC